VSAPIAPPHVPGRRASTATPVDLSGRFDNRGITAADERTGAFNIWSNTFPAEQLPAPGGIVEVTGVPFRFPAGGPGRADNLRCSGQLLTVPPGRYDWIYALAAAERRTEDRVDLHYANGAVDAEWLRVSDFWPQTPAWFGEPLAYRCTRMHYPRHVETRMGPAIWRPRIPVTRPQELRALRLPDNPAMHVFALTLVAPAEVIR
jgi:hypothetical protein